MTALNYRYRKATIVAERGEEVRQEVMFFTTHSQALEYRKRLSRTGAGAAFGIDATTFASWLADTWELYGDGRDIASPLDRSFAVRQLLSDAPELSALKLTDGGISLVCRFLADVLGSSRLEESLSNPPSGLSVQEQAVLSLVPLYRALLDSRGLVDSGDALRVLAGVCPPCSFVLQEGVEPGLAFEDFVEANGSELRGTPVPALVGPTPEGCRPLFLLAAGPSCQDAQISNYLSGLLADTRADGEALRILVCTSRPFAVFEALSRSLSEVATCSLRASRPFPQTQFGRAFLSVREYLLDPIHDPSALMDYLASPFSGVSELDAAKVYSQVRGDRTLGFDDLRAMAHLLSPAFDLFEELVTDSDASLLLDRFLDIADELGGFDAGAAFEQEVAISALRGVYEAARIWGVAPSGLSFALQGITVDASRVCGTSDAQIEVVDASWTDRLPEGKYDAVVVCDLDARYWGAGEPHNAIVGLEEKLGFPPRSHALADARRRFEGLKARAKSVFACQRVLTAGGDEEVYPSFVLDEFCAALCKGPSDELDDFGIPASLADSVLVRNEGGSASPFSANFDFGGEQPSSFSIPGFAPGAVSKEWVADLSLYRAPDNPDLLVLSPSAIEEYVNCPYRWFASRRLRPQAPDELLGPMEQGVFVHGVLEEFYSRIEGELGVKRVSPENLSESQALLERVFDEVLAAQPEVQDNARFIPLTPVERARAMRLKQILARNLAVQAQLMPSFAPLLLECQVKPEQAIDYAGVRVMGRADRVDVDAQRGCFAVIDYKGGISGHEAGFDPDKAEEVCLPSKIQALVYAQALQRGIVDAKPVGALYLSYRASMAKGSVAGSFDDALLDLQGFAGSKSAVKMNFSTYLDMVEELVGEKLARLYEGCIEPNPAAAQSCKYCPVANCERRLS